MSSRTAKFAAVLALGVALAACHPKAAPAQSDAPTAAAGQAFLDKNAKDPGVKTTPSGLQYKILRSGPADGTPPKKGDEVKVHYEGTLVDGTVFDSSYARGQPAVFTVGELVPGWNEALTMMRPGDQWYVYLPSKLGYGPEGAGPIPPDSVLVFKMELLGVLPHEGAAQQG